MATPTVPLNCSICPKRPRFSDISHLLTHVASKGHLSHYYKTKVRAANEPTSKDAIDIYDAWYKEWRIESLMSARLHSKDQRRTGIKEHKAAVKEQVTRHQVTKIHDSSTSVLDPRLCTNSTKLEEPSVQEDADIHYPYRFSDPMNDSELEPSKKPAMFLYQTNRPLDYHATPVGAPGLSEGTVRKSIYDFESLFADNCFLNPAQDEEENEVLTEATRLKGVFWPGMAIFDAATPSMKRKRNQKKDTSVVEQLESRSLQVEAIEVVYTPGGTKRKELTISGQVDPDSSPIRVEQPVKRRSSRNILKELDPNMLRNRQFGNHDKTSSYKVTGRPSRSRRPSPDETSKRNFCVHPDSPPFGNPCGIRYLTASFPVFDESSLRERLPHYQPHPIDLLETSYFSQTRAPYHGIFSLPTSSYISQELAVNGFYFRSSPPVQDSVEDDATVSDTSVG